MARKVFITGATGNIGGKLVARILREDSEAELVLLVRGDTDSEASHRLLSCLQALNPEINLDDFRERARVLGGDITQENLGLSERTVRTETSGLTHIVHAAAATEFQLPLECAHLVNVVGTRNVLNFAIRAQQRGSLEQLAHISTAYVCGGKCGTISEDNIENHSGFGNTYELTKWVAEKSVRRLMPELPITIIRPSIVVGDSETGRTLVFNVLYSPLRFIQRGLLNHLPCPANMPLDVVPLDYVANTIQHLLFSQANSVGKCYHLVAGPENSPTVGEIVDAFLNVARHYGNTRTLKPMRYIPEGLDKIAPLLSPAEVKRVIPFIKVYEPYLTVRRSFDSSNTMAAIKGTGIEMPKFADYCGNIFRYCLKADWSKPVKRAA